MNGFQNFLIKDFFDLSKFDNDQFVLVKEEFNMNELALDVIDLSNLNAEQKGLTIELVNHLTA